MPGFSRKKIIYVYDALCPWCYAFTPVVRALYEHYRNRFDFEVLSGGMIRRDEVRVIQGEEEANRLRDDYCRIEEIAGIQFGQRFFSGIAIEGRRLESEPPAIALAAFRTLESGRSEIEFAHAMIRSVFSDGGDPNDAQFYQRIADELQLDAEALLAEMGKQESTDQALYDFSLAKQLGAESFPRLYLQTAEDYLHLISKGYSDFDRVRKIIDTIELGK